MAMTIESLSAQGLAWLVDGSFLGHLAAEQQAALLDGASMKDFARDELLIEGGAQAVGVCVIVAGHAHVEVPGDAGEKHVVARVGQGHLLGERAILRNEPTGADVRAVSPLRVLFIPAEHFRAMLDQSAPLKELVTDLVDVRERSQLMLQLLLRDPILRALGRDDLERLMQSGQVLRVPPGGAVVKAGELSSDVYLVIRGEVAVFAPATGENPRTMVATNGPGWLFGHAAVLLELPRTADVEATRTTELLRISDRAFMDVVSRNAPLQRRLYQHLASLDLNAEAALAHTENAFTVAVWGARRNSGATTLAYGLAAALRDGGAVTLVDLDGERSAKRLDRRTRRGKLGGIPIVRMQVPEEWRLRVVWPQDRTQASRLVDALRDRAKPGESVVVGMGQAQQLDAEIVGSTQANVFVRWAADAGTDAVDHGGFRVDAVRIQGDVEMPMATARSAVRMLDDAETVSNFWYGRRLDALVDDGTRYGRAAKRLVRVLHGRTVGLALGGGGALGYAHVGLIKALEENDVAIDYISGSSFGSLVGAMYVAGGMEFLDVLVRERAMVRQKVMVGMATLSPCVNWLKRYIGEQTLGTTEIPFLPVTLDIASGQEVVVTRGTIVEGFRKSASFPGFFPAIRSAGRRLVDGGIINNVPASVVWDAGASFIIASNVIPPHPVGREPALGDSFFTKFKSNTYARFDDLLRAVFLMMSQIGRDRAAIADYVFDLDIQGYNLYDFMAGADIAEAGYNHALSEMDDILYMRETDPSIRVGRK